MVPKEVDAPPEEVMPTFCAKLTETYLTLSNYVGQTNNVEYLNGHIRLCVENNKPLPHVILWGHGGLGKSTLIKATAHELGCRFFEIIPANMRTVKDLFGLLFSKQCPSCGGVNPFSTNKCLHCRQNISIYFTPVLKIVEKDIIFFEECHGLRTEIEEALYSLMQDSYIMLRYNGVDQRVMIPPVTIAGATTKLGDLNKPFRDRFKIDIHLNPYTDEDIVKIIKTYCKMKDVVIHDEAAEHISKISYGIPRIAKKYVDDSITRGKEVTKTTLDSILYLKGVDSNGLDNICRNILSYIHNRNQAGMAAIAASAGITANEYEEVYEPALLYNELIWQGNRGRVLTPKALDVYFNGCKCKYCVRKD
ncbi:AAA family ATPase [Candidatus Dojkabacteria bacterium]|nr:AAA family ATPase [Candidatus Dojkabacteria bacterium]